jgi:quinol monooxygenase YgiN
MATMLAHITIHPGREREFEAVAAELWKRTHADETGVARYEYWRGAAPGTYYALGSFDGYDGFIRHQTSVHHVAAGAALKELIAGMRLEWIDPVDGSNGLPPTNSTDAPLDAGELERSHRTRHAAQVQDWWLPLRHDESNNSLGLS